MSQKKKRTRLKPPAQRDEPMVGYVRRTAPKSWLGVRLPPKLGRVDHIHDLYPDLESVVERNHGGGEFRVRLYDEKNKKLYLGTYHISMPGQPLKDGEPIKPKAKETNRESGIKKEIRETRLEKEFHNEEVKLSKARIRHRRAEAAERQSCEPEASNPRLAPPEKEFERLKEQREKRHQREEKEEDSRRRRKEEEQRRKEERREREFLEKTCPPTEVEAKDATPPEAVLVTLAAAQVQKFTTAAMANNTGFINAAAEVHRQNSEALSKIAESDRQEPVPPVISQMLSNVEPSSLFFRLLDVDAKAVDRMLDVKRMQAERETETRHQQGELAARAWQSTMAFALEEQKEREREAQALKWNSVVNNMVETLKHILPGSRTTQPELDKLHRDIRNMLKAAAEEYLEDERAADHKKWIDKLPRSIKNMGKAAKAAAEEYLSCDK